MSIHYLDYTAIIQLPPVDIHKGKITDAKSRIIQGSFRDDIDEILRERLFRQAVAILAMVIEAAHLYSPARFTCREKEEAT
jgi:hypothetical protein